MRLVFYVILLGQYFLGLQGKWVMDVDSSIIDEINQNPSIGYLIKFHAPWCGHCRKFEPVYEEIAQAVQADDELKDNIRIVRIDATVHSNVANYYDIRGFPTVKFIRGTQIISYDNERSKSAVLNFLKRVNGPAIRWISSIDEFEQARREHDVFFLLLTTHEDDPLVKEYTDNVNRYLSQAYFYATNASIIEETYFSEYSSGIFAVKSDGFYPYKSENTSLDDFILKEKVTTFPQVSAGNMYDLILTKKIIVIYGFQEQNERTKLKSQINNYVIKHSSTLHEQFQFAWTNDLELLNNIAVWTIEDPLIFLYDSHQRNYGVYPLSTKLNENTDIETILDEIISNHAEIIQLTGNTWRKRFIRPFWEFYRAIMAMFIEAPLLSMLVIGLPSAILSIICYCLCCLPNEALLDEREMDDNIEKTTSEKKDD